MFNWEAIEKRMAKMVGSDAELELIDEILDAAMAGDEVRLRELFDQHPNLREEFEGLNRGYAEFQAAMRSDPVWYEQEYAAARQEIDELIAEVEQQEKESIGFLTRATRDWPEHAVRDFYESSARWVVLLISDAAKHIRSPQQILLDAAYLCSQAMIKRLRATAQTQGHVRDVLIEVLAERWNDPALSQRLTRKELDELIKKERSLARNLKILEAYLEAA